MSLNASSLSLTEPILSLTEGLYISVAVVHFVLDRNEGQLTFEEETNKKLVLLPGMRLCECIYVFFLKRVLMFTSNMSRALVIFVI